jgi:hypothetical protein
MQNLARRGRPSVRAPSAPIVVRVLRADVQAVVDRLVAGPWGARTSTPGGAENMCKRTAATLVSLLRRAGIRDAEIWSFGGYLGQGPPPPGHVAGGMHMVVVIDGMAVDFTARQFDARHDHPRVVDLSVLCQEWSNGAPVSPDGPWNAFTPQFDRFPADWEGIADVDPTEGMPPWPGEGSA